MITFYSAHTSITYMQIVTGIYWRLGLYLRTSFSQYQYVGPASIRGFHSVSAHMNNTLTKWILTANPLNDFHAEVLSSICSSVWTSVPPLYPDVELFSTSRLRAGAAITLQGWCWNSHDRSSFTTIISSHITLTIKSHIQYNTIIGKLKLRVTLHTKSCVWSRADTLQVLHFWHGFTVPNPWQWWWQYAVQ